VWRGSLVPRSRFFPAVQSRSFLAGLFGSEGGAPAVEADTAPTNVTAEETAVRVKQLYAKYLDPLNKSLMGPLERSSQDMLPRPCVLVIGNHR
jgi:hypothetical protein